MKCKKDLQKYKKRWKSMEFWTKSFCFVSTANYLFLLLLGTWLFVVRLQTHNNWSTIITGIIGLLMIIFLVYLSFEGLFHDNIYELYTVFLAQGFITVIVAGALVLTWGDWGAQQYTSIAYASIFLLLYVMYLYPLYTEYSWTFFQKAGGDPTFRQLYRRFLRFLALLKIEAMALVVTTLIISNIYNAWLVWMFTFDVAVICGAILLYMLGVLAFQEEINFLAFAFWTFNMFIPALIVWCFFYIPEASRSFLDEGDKKGFLIIVGAACVTLFIVWICVMVSSVMLYPHFGEGLNNLDDLRKKKKTKRDKGGGKEDKGLIRAPAGKDTNEEEEEEEEEEDNGSSRNVFDEIFQNTQAKNEELRKDFHPEESPVVSTRFSNYDDYKQKHGL